MEYRTIGRTSLSVSIVGLGTVKIGRCEQVKYPRSFDIPSDDEVVHLLQIAQEVGINLIDTAPAYGTSEERLGALLPGSRDSWVISTKFGETFVDGRSSFDFSPESVLPSVQRSLDRLRTDYLDMVLIHSDGNDLHIINSLGTLEALDDLKRTGLIRAFGISTKTPEGGLAALDKCDLVMVTYNQNETDCRDVIREAYEKQTGVLVKKALQSGHLANDQVIGAKATPEEAIRFVLKEGGVSSVIVGTINPEHLRESVGVIEGL